MYYDLNVPWPSSSSSSEAGPSAGKKKKGKAPQAEVPAAPEVLKGEDERRLGAILDDLSSFGYSTVAFNRIAHSRFDPAVHSNPLPNSQPFPASKLTQLSRLTVVLDSASMGKAGSGLISSNATALQSYDLLAVRPLNEAAFQHACLTLAELRPFSIDIISLDLAAAPRLPFFLKRSTVNAALENGVVFEICYGPVVGGKCDGIEDGLSKVKARRNLISGARDLLRVTNGKGVIFSSGALEALCLRGPYDVINLAAVVGMNQAAAKDAISNNPRSLIVRAKTRRTYRGVVSHPVIVDAPPTPTLKRKSPQQDEPKRKKKKT